MEFSQAGTHLHGEAETSFNRVRILLKPVLQADTWTVGKLENKERLHVIPLPRHGAVRGGGSCAKSTQGESVSLALQRFDASHLIFQVLLDAGSAFGEWKRSLESILVKGLAIAQRITLEDVPKATASDQSEALVQAASLRSGAGSSSNIGCIALTFARAQTNKGVSHSLLRVCISWEGAGDLDSFNAAASFGDAVDDGSSASGIGCGVFLALPGVFKHACAYV